MLKTDRSVTGSPPSLLLQLRKELARAWTSHQGAPSASTCNK